jgi:cell division protein FtsW (lipid II flippase)
MKPFIRENFGPLPEFLNDSPYNFMIEAEEFGLIKAQSTVITFLTLQTFFFIILTSCLDSNWELLLISHISLLLSLFFEQKVPKT